MKRPPKVPALQPDGPHSAIYIAARTEWNERYGSYIAQAHAWRLTALASLGVAFVAVAGVVWIGAQSRVVPYVVQTDKLGDALAISRADIAAPADPRLIRAGLARWIEDIRTVYLDVAAERAVVKEAYTMVNRNGAAAQQLNDWFSHNDPFKRARSEMVGVSVESVLPISGNTWRVEWQEDRRGRDGTADQPASWQATISISIDPPSNDATILVNPAGLYVDSFEWAQRQ
jgi:type IV secretion system protein TrbF